MTPVTDPAILAQLNGPQAGPKPVTDPAILAQLNGETPKGFMANAEDFVKSIPRGIMSNLASSASYAGESPVPPPDALMASTPEKMAVLDKSFDLHQPQGRAGRFGEAAGGAIGNPLTYAGPGGLALKVGGSILSGLVSEGAGQATEGTKYEGPARIAGALVGGMAAAKTLGPSAPKAQVPTYPELKDAYDAGYKRAAASGLEFDPHGISQFATTARNDLSSGQRPFTPRSAPETFGILDELGNPPSATGATTKFDSNSINQLRQDLNAIAGKVQPTTTPGVFKSTPDAAAASALKQRLNDYLENLPQGHVVAGDPKAYVDAIREANGNFGAAERLKGVLSRIDTAKENAAGQIAGSVDQQLRAQARQLLKSKSARGLTPEEVAATQYLNRGSFGQNVLSQVGRGGAGVVPMIAQAAVGLPAAFATGGLSVIPQAAFAAALYGARKGGEAATMGRAQKLADLLAKRSPLYQSRVNALPAADTLSNKAAIARALLQVR